MMGNKRRSFSRKFSSSVTGEFADLAAATPDIVTPLAKIDVQEGSELAGTPGQNHHHQPRANPPAQSQAAAAAAAATLAAVESKKAAAMTQKREDVLTAKHSERVLVVGKGVILTANVTSCDKVVVEGQFQGNIKTGTFVLSEGGQMEGEVRCSDGCIGGNMKATITATKTLLIGKAAVVTGDMVYDSLQVVDGGRLQGKLTHVSAADKPKPAVQQAAA